LGLNRIRRLNWSALLRLLLLLILKLLAALLHLLQELFWATALTRWGNNPRTAHGRFRLVYGLGILLRLVFAALIPIRAWLAYGMGLGGEDEFAGGSLALVADHQYVVARAIEQVCEHVAGGRGTVAAENALIVLDAFHLHSSSRRNIFQDLIQAGVGRADAEVPAVPVD
jgi:hypothetical protein